MLKVKNNPIYVAVIDFSASKCIRVKITSCSEWNEKLNEINATETRKLAAFEDSRLLLT